MAAPSEPDPLPPGGSSPVRALAWAVAAQQAAVAVLWMDLLHPFAGRRLSLAGVGAPVLVVTVVVAAAHVLVPVAARARSGTGAVASSMALCAVGGGLASLVSAPLAHVGSTFAPGVTRLHIVLDDMFGGAVAGFFSGIAAATIVVHRLRMRDQALDGAVRIYAFAGASLLPTAVLLAALGLGLHGALTSGALCLVASAGLLYAASASRRRRLVWIHAVREGRVPGFRVEEAEAPAGLPPFAGSGEGARGVLLHEVVDVGAHPFRGAHRPGPVARVQLDGDEGERQARAALRRSVASGTLAGIAVLLALLVPACLLVIAIGA